MWSHDYCTVCDKQCSPGSMYCSDTCRLSEQSSCGTVSYSTDTVYSTLYTTGRHHSLSSPYHPPQQPQYSSHSPMSNAASPALTTASSPLSLQSLHSNEEYFGCAPATPPLSPMLLCQQPRGQATHHHHEHGQGLKVPKGGNSPMLSTSGGADEMAQFANTSTNYKRWLSSVV